MSSAFPAGLEEASHIILGSILVFTCPAWLQSQDAVALARQGLELMNQGRYREAEVPLLRALELAGPENPTAVYNLAALYHRQGRSNLSAVARCIN